MANKGATLTLPGGTKVTCSEEQAKKYAASESKAPVKRGSSSKTKSED